MQGAINVQVTADPDANWLTAKRNPSSPVPRKTSVRFKRRESFRTRFVVGSWWQSGGVVHRSPMKPATFLG